LDDRLKHHNSGVQLAAIKVFIKLTEGTPEIQEDVYKRMKGTVMIYNPRK
jgi:hypothetical protein